MLPPHLKRVAEKRAKSLGMSLGHFIREALQTAVENAGSGVDPLFDYQKVYTGNTPRDLAQKHDDYLYGE